MGKLLDRISEPALAGAIRDHDIDPADALRQLQSQGCLEQHSQNFDIWQWIVPSAHAASCTLTTLSGKTITITDREGCIAALVDSFYAQTIGIVENRQAFEEGLMNGVKGQCKEFVDLFSDPTGMAKALTNVAWEIANDPVAAGLKYGFNAADALSESSALYIKALANNDYVTAGEYMGRFAMDMAIAIGTAEAGSAIEGALFGAREAEALEKVKLTSTAKIALQIDSGKFDYLFGRVTSNPHNTARSHQLQSELSHVGIYDTPSGRATLTSHFSDVASDPTTVVRAFSETRNGVTQNFTVRESLLSGPGGVVRLERTFETMADGTQRFITTIPYR